MDGYIDFIRRWRILILVLSGLLIGLFGYMLFRAELDLSTEGFLLPNDPKITQYRQFQDIFDNDILGMLAIDGDVFSGDFLAKLYELQKDLESELPYLKESLSIINSDFFYSKTDDSGEPTLVATNIQNDLANRSLSREKIDRLKTSILSIPLRNNQFISYDLGTTIVLLRFYSGQEIERNALQNKNSSTQYGGQKVRGSTNKGTDFTELDSLFDDTSTDTQNAAKVYENTSINTGSTADSNVGGYIKDRDENNLYLNNAQSKEVFDALNTIVKRHEDDDFEVAILGPIFYMVELVDALTRDLKILLPLLVFVVLGIMYLLFKRISAIVYTLIIIALTNISMFGMMGLLGVKITLMTNSLPMIMIGIVLGAVVHFLVQVYAHYDKGQEMSASLKMALSNSGVPIILTNLTSAAGIISFAVSSVKPMRDFGIFGALSLLCALFGILLMLPALMMSIGITRVPPRKQRTADLIDSTLHRHAGIAYRQRGLTIILSLVMVLVGIYGVKNIRFSHKPLEWLPEESQLLRDTKEVDERLGGSNLLDIFIDTGITDGVLEPQFLEKLDTLEGYINTHGFNTRGAIKSVGKIWGIHNLVKQIHMIFHNADDAYYSIPEKKDLVAQELLLVENSPLLRALSDSSYRYTRLSISLPDLDAIYFTQFLEDLEAKISELFTDEPRYEFYSTGWVALLSKIISETIESARRSYLIAFGVIAILMILLTKNIVLGLVSMIPNVLPLFVLLGVISYTAISLDMFVLLLGCVLLGVAVDDTIHFVHLYTHNIRKGSDTEEAIRKSFMMGGRAMITTSLLLVSGFGVLFFAQMRNFRNFVILAVIGIICALFADFFLTPALMSYVSRGDKRVKDST